MALPNTLSLETWFMPQATVGCVENTRKMHCSWVTVFYVYASIVENKSEKISDIHSAEPIYPTTQQKVSDLSDDQCANSLLHVTEAW